MKKQDQKALATKLWAQYAEDTGVLMAVTRDFFFLAIKDAVAEVEKALYREAVVKTEKELSL